MRELVRNVRVVLLPWEEVSPQDQELLTIAVAARENAVAAYSHYCVGAAIRWRKGHVSRGCNIENCVYEVLHAEKGAIGNGISQNGLDKIEKVAVIGAPEGQKIPPPATTTAEFETAAAQINFEDASVCCANCLQDVTEFIYGDSNVELMQLTNGVVVKITIGDILTARFEPMHLGVDYSKRP